MRGKSILTQFLLFLLFLSALRPTAFGKIIYVDDDATGANDGSSWENAYTYLQDALADANSVEKPVEIRVAQGTYKPDQGAGQTPGDRDAVFQLISDVTLSGGYAGLTESDPDVRDVELYKTILSGDLEQDDGPESMNITDNSYHVLTSNRTGQTAVLDGITITAGGYFDSYSLEAIDYRDRGGGMYNDYSSPTLTNCTFTANNGRAGAGMFNYYSSPILIDCTFIENSADEYGGGMFNSYSNPRLCNCAFIANSAAGDSGGYFTEEGGGIYNDFSRPTLLNCTFTENTAGYTGGGIYNNRSEPVMTNCTFNENSTWNGGGVYNSNSIQMLTDCHFVGNSVASVGGAVFSYSGTSTFLNCTFKENSASGNGGAVFNNSNTSGRVNMMNCVFSGNSARNGGAIMNKRVLPFRSFMSNNTTDYNPSVVFLLNCTLSANIARQAGGAISSDIEHFSIRDVETGLHNGTTLVNCILWNNTPDEIKQYESNEDVNESVVVFYSDVQGGFPGQGNIDVDPLFADPNNDDYHLKSHEGRYDPARDAWVIDDVTSPCIDAGDPNTSVGLEYFPDGNVINMGAYGGTPEASLTPRQKYTLPAQASNPYPADEAIDVDVDAILSWSAGSNAVLHNVYFGTDFNDVKLSNIDDTRDVLVSVNQSSASFYLEPLWSGQTYYWRVDEVDNQGAIVTGVIWSFTTALPPPKGRGCFTPATGVWSDGKLVPISKVTPSRIINVIDCIKIIEDVQEHQGIFTLYDIVLESGNCITVAENHYFMSESGRWLSLHELTKGEKLKTSKGSIGIKSITKQPKPYIGKVYNLEIQGSDKYMVGEDAVIVRDY